MLTENNYIVTCDVGECQNRSAYTLPTKGRLSRFYICESCVKEIVSDYNKATTPISPRNVFNDEKTSMGALK